MSIVVFNGAILTVEKQIPSESNISVEHVLMLLQLPSNYNLYLPTRLTCPLCCGRCR